MLKDIFEKVASGLIITACLGLCTLFYNEYETYKEVKKLPAIKEELERKFVFSVEKLQKQVNHLETQHRKDSLEIIYLKKWVNYWRGLE